MRRLSKANFERGFIRAALLPDWWDKSCESDPSLLAEFEFRVARFLGAPLQTVRDPGLDLSIAAPADARLRRVRDIDKDRLGPAIHAGQQIAAAVVRNLRNPGPVTPLPNDPLELRRSILERECRIDLKHIAKQLWLRGIPVIVLESAPAPSFQGMACIVEGRPAIVLAQKYDAPGHVTFIIAHEAGHVAAGDCAVGAPVVDEIEASAPGDESERNADAFALRLQCGTDVPATLDVPADPKALAIAAARLEAETGQDASALIFAWARRYQARVKDNTAYSTAMNAVKALYRANGARATLARLFPEYVNLEAAPESDRLLLRCVMGGVPDESGD